MNQMQFFDQDDPTEPDVRPEDEPEGGVTPEGPWVPQPDAPGTSEESGEEEETQTEPEE